jgi:hypothetical protein
MKPGPELSNYLTRTLLSAMLVLTPSCLGERDTLITVEGGNPPSFIMTGSGKLTTLRVTGPRKLREGVAEEPYVIWEIEFKGDGYARNVERLSPIVYGDVPEGYIQVIPHPSHPAPPISEGELYGVNAITMNANGGRVGFAIHKGEAVVDPEVPDGKPILP